MKILKNKAAFIIALLLCTFIISYYFLPKNFDILSFSSKNLIEFKQNKFNKDLLEIAVTANNLEEEIMGIAFNLEYDSKSLEYKNYLQGDFLEKGGEPIYLCSPKKTNKNIIVCGISLKRGDQFLNGSGNIIYLYFNIKSAKWDKFKISNTFASRLENNERKNLENIIFKL